jgi:hypothetical protein
MKTATNILFENTNRCENLVIIFEITLKMYRISENFRNRKVSKFDKLSNGILFA